MEFSLVLLPTTANSTNKQSTRHNTPHRRTDDTDMAFRAAVEQIDVMSSPPDEEGMTITVETMVSARVW